MKKPKKASTQQDAKGRDGARKKEPADVQAADDLMGKLLQVPKSEVDQLDTQRHKRSKPA